MWNQFPYFDAPHWNIHLVLHRSSLSYNIRICTHNSCKNVWLQNITTKEPDDDMIECAIAAIKEAIPEDQSDNW